MLRSTSQEMFRSTIFLLLNVLVFNGIIAQQEAKNWHFGETNFGLQFNGGQKPDFTFNSFTPYGNEGASVLSDPVTGDLMFYTDGISVVDKSHQPMPNGNGLRSNISTSGTARICPIPNDCGKYYIFHSDTEMGVNPMGNLYYSIVDLKAVGNGTASAPLGDVILKNQLIMENVSEALDVVPKNAYGHEYWLIAAKNFPSELHVFDVRFNGLFPHQSISISPRLSDIRCVRHNPVDDRLAICSLVENEPIMVIEFDALTGNTGIIHQVAGTPVGNSTIVGNGFYDIEWSPDGSKFYVSKYKSVNEGGSIYQVDASNFQQPISKIIQLANIPTNQARGLRKGPDGRIYFLYRDDLSQVNNIGAILRPNLPGTACLPDPTFLVTPELKNTHLFPHFLKLSNTVPKIADRIITQNYCEDTTGRFTFSPLQDVKDNESDQLFIEILHSTPGSWTITNNGTTVQIEVGKSHLGVLVLTLQVCDDYCPRLCDTFKWVLNRKINTIDLGLDRQLQACLGDTLQVNAATRAGITNIQWSDGTMGPILNATTTGVFVVNAEDAKGCRYSDTITTHFAPAPLLDLGPDTSVCRESSITLKNHFGNTGTFLWSTGSKADSLAVNEPGSYSLQVESNGCISTDSINVKVAPSPVLELGPDTIVCDNSVLLTPFFYTGTLQWWDGTVGAEKWVVSDGTYIAKASLSGCSVEDKISVKFPYLPIPVLKGEPICKDTVTYINLPVDQNYIYEFENELITPPLKIPTADGTYYLTLKNECFSVIDSFVLNQGPCNGGIVFPNAFTPNADGKNDFFKGVSTGDFDNFELCVYNRYGELLWCSDRPEGSWDGYVNGKRAQQGVYVWQLKFTVPQNPKLNYLRGTVLLLD